MNIRNWSVCLVEPNKFEAKIIIDLLRNAGVNKLAHYPDGDLAMAALELQSPNVVIASVDLTPMGGVEWTRLFRRNHKLANRKAAIFLTSNAFSRAVAEQCRHAGANALIGKPVSGKTLTATITKVLAQPREFIDAAGYVGPCRRAGIVTAGPIRRRRRADNSAAAGAAPNDAAAGLAKAVTDLLEGRGEPAGCETALAAVQAEAKAAGDEPMLRACAALAEQLASPTLRTTAAKSALNTCVSKISQLAQTPVSERERRAAMAEAARGAVAKAQALAAA